MRWFAILLLATTVNATPVAVHVTPDRAPDGFIWRIAINGKQLDRFRDGVYRADVPDGEALLWIASESGDSWLERDVNVTPTSHDFNATVESRHIAGVVSIGGKPVAARLTIGDPNREHWFLQTNERGEFAGDVREGLAGPWLIDVSAGHVRRNIQVDDLSNDSLHLDLPHCAVNIRVLDEDGTSNARARIVINGNTNVRPGWQGLEPGTYRMLAFGEGTMSREPEELTLAEGDERDVVMTLARPLTIRGRVSEQGRPIAGVMVYGGSFAIAATNDQGEFELDVPAGTTSLPLEIEHPKYRTERETFAVTNGTHLTIEAHSLEHAPDLPREIP